LFREDVHHRLRFCLDRLSCVKMADFRFYLQTGKVWKVGWVGTTVVLFLFKNMLVRCRYAISRSFVAKVLREVLATFSVAVKGHSSIAELIVWPARTNSLWTVTCCQRKWWVCSWLCSASVSPFTVSVNLNFLSTAYAFFPERLSNHCHGVRCAFSKICTQFEAVLCWIQRKIA
jgi:hypothetical protein